MGRDESRPHNHFFKITTQSIMKNLMIITITLVAAHLLFTPDLLAQPPGLPDSPDQAPIDGGLLWLLIGGGAYGVKKLRDRNKADIEN